MNNVTVNGPNTITINYPASSGLPFPYPGFIKGGSNLSIFGQVVGAVVVNNGNTANRGIITSWGGWGGQSTITFPSGVDTSSWSTGAGIAFDLYLPFTAEVQFMNYFSDPSKRQRFTDLKMFTRQPYFYSADLSLSTDIRPALSYMAGELLGWSNSVNWATSFNQQVTQAADAFVEDKTFNRIIDPAYQNASQIRIGFRSQYAMAYFNLNGYDLTTNTGGGNIERNNNV
jgi:rhodanese-related sulfurtransferase